MKQLVTISGFLPSAQPSIVDGIHIVSRVSLRTRGWKGEIDITISVDLTVITAAVAAAWLTSAVWGSGSDAELYIDGKQVPADESEIVERLEAQNEGE